MNTETIVGTIGPLTTGFAYTGGMYSNPVIIAVQVGEISVLVTKRATPNFTYAVIGPNSRPPDMVWREVWEIEDGKLIRKEDVHGRHTPSQTLPEAIEFPAP